jgi:hypothetical protein
MRQLVPVRRDRPVEAAVSPDDPLYEREVGRLESALPEQECDDGEREHTDAQVDDGRDRWQREPYGPRKRPAPA